MFLTKRYYFKNPNAPTSYNLIQKLKANHWKEALSLKAADFGDAQLAFDEEVSKCLEFKHFLAQFLQVHVPGLSPCTFAVDDDNWPFVLQALAGDETVWILKPALQNNGQNIHIFQSIEAIKAHFLSKSRLGGPHVLQRYIHDPDLLRDKRKYSIRLFLVLTNYMGAFLYPDGYINVANYPYQKGSYTDLRSHLTNEHLYAHEANVLQIPTNRFDWFASLYPKVLMAVEKLVQALVKVYPKAFMQRLEEQKTLAIFGLDFMLDAEKRIWLLEANHGPCFPIDEHHPLQKYLYQDFWDAFVNQFVFSISPSPSSNAFIYLK